MSPLSSPGTANFEKSLSPSSPPFVHHVCVHLGTRKILLYSQEKKEEKECYLNAAAGR